MYKKITALLLLISLYSFGNVYAASNFSYSQNVPNQDNQYTQKPLTYDNKPLQGYVVVVPAGESVPVTLMTPVSSETAAIGQTISAILGNDFEHNGKVVAPRGSTVSGSVIEVSKAKHGSLNGKICIRFTQIVTPYGTQIPISAVIKTDDSTGVLVGGTKKDVAVDYAKDLAIGSAAGAVSGVVFGALAGGSIGRGAALGTAVGAGGGLVKSAWDKGNDVEIPVNATIDLILTQPITASATNYSYEN